MSEEQSALEIWKEKLKEFQKQEAIASNVAEKFQIRKQIEECKQKIQELEEQDEPKNTIIQNKIIVTIEIHYSFDDLQDQGTSIENITLNLSKVLKEMSNFNNIEKTEVYKDADEEQLVE